MTTYGVMYADPPWTFKTFSAKGKGRSPEAHYSCMSLPDIQALPVADWAAADCVLFLWVTNPMLQAGLETMQKWGFTYKTVGFTWVKLNRSGKGWFFGLGYHTRANAELCLLGTRGKPKRLSAGVSSLVVDPVRQHSRKPDDVRSRIRALYNGPYLEMFARESTPGWDAWGDQTGLFDHGDVETRMIPSDLRGSS